MYSAASLLSSTMTWMWFDFEFFTAEHKKYPLEEAKSPFIKADEPEFSSSMNKEIFFAASKPENLDTIPSIFPISDCKVKKYVINHVDNFVKRNGSLKKLKNRPESNMKTPGFSTSVKLKNMFPTYLKKRLFKFSTLSTGYNNN